MGKKKSLSENELEKVSGGITYLNGVCTVCGKTFGTSNNLRVEYKGGNCQAKTEVYHCDSCDGVVEFQSVTGDGS